LCFGWSTSWVWPFAASLGRFSTARLSCFAVYPTFAFVSAEPFSESFFSHYFFPLDLLPQLAAPTFLHLTNAPEAYAEGHLVYLLFTL
jgi:hypothetical protein